MSFWDLNLKYTPCGSQTLSKMPNRFVEGVYPKLLEVGQGGVVQDLKGKAYIDLISGLGAISVGYCNPKVDHVAKYQIGLGVSFSLPNRLEGELAQKLTELVPYTEQWKFLKTGTEATTSAIKAARAYTNRNKVMVCGYHGWNDWYATLNNRKAGIPEFNNELVTRAIYNDLLSFSDLFSNTYAAVIIEPYVFDMPKEGFFEALRIMCHRTGTLLIFDEVVTGGRTKGFVSSTLFGIEPDITVLSKGIANGFPLAAVGAKRRIMQTFERDDFFVSGTFGGECVSLAACLATVKILEKSVDRMIEKGNKIKDYFNEVFHSYKGVICKGYPTRLTFDFPTKEHKALFMQEMCLNGVLIGYSNMVMVDHTEQDISRILSAIHFSEFVLDDNWNNPQGALRGPMPVETLRLR